MLLAGWDLTELLLVMGTLLLCSYRKQPPLCLYDITGIWERFSWLLFFSNLIPSLLPLRSSISF